MEQARNSTIIIHVVPNVRYLFELFNPAHVTDALLTYALLRMFLNGDKWGPCRVTLEAHVMGISNATPNIHYDSGSDVVCNILILKIFAHTIPPTIIYFGFIPLEIPHVM